MYVSHVIRTHDVYQSALLCSCYMTCHIIFVVSWKEGRMVQSERPLLSSWRSKHIRTHYFLTFSRRIWLYTSNSNIRTWSSTVIINRTGLRMQTEKKSCRLQCSSSNVTDVPYCMQHCHKTSTFLNTQATHRDNGPSQRDRHIHGTAQEIR